MAHLLRYEDAVTPLEKALAALDCADAKASNSGAWSWAETAANHAAEAGIENASQLLGDGRRPNTSALRSALEGSQQSVEGLLQELADQLVAQGVAATASGDCIIVGGFELVVTSIFKKDKES